MSMHVFISDVLGVVTHFCHTSRNVIMCARYMNSLHNTAKDEGRLSKSYQYLSSVTVQQKEQPKPKQNSRYGCIYHT
jgi:hypothetical protein